MENPKEISKLIKNISGLLIGLISVSFIIILHLLLVQATKTDPMLHSHPVQAVEFSIKEANIIVTNMLKK